MSREGILWTGKASRSGRMGKNPLELSLPLLGVHQVVNAATAFAALQAGGLKLTDEQLQKGFASVSWPCRFEVVRREPPVVLDSAHNTDSFEKLMQTLEDYFPGRMVTLIFGSSEDKDIAGMIQALKPCLKRIIATKAVHPRALELEKIADTAAFLQIPSEMVEPVGAALKRGLELSAKDGSIVLSAGSMFVTAEAKTEWEKIVNPLES